MKSPALLRNLLLAFLAAIFSISLMFAFTELPRLLDTALQENVPFPGLDHGSNETSAYKAEIYIHAMNLRWIGYASLILVVAFIALGFVTKRSGWAMAGAFTLFLPVFGQFAMSMFFLAGLGMLRVGWLPFWDISFQVLDLGEVIFIPYWILMWGFRQFGIWAQPEIGWFFMTSGAFLFTWGVLVWMQSRFSKKGIATSWIYRISRHPQYLGWIIWTYGLIIYTPLINQMKKSWGMTSSLPWLLMTMIIIGICMLEELKMSKQYGKEYDAYRNKTPFLFPAPKWFKKIIKYPMWLLIRKPRPEKKKEIALVLIVYTLLLISISMLWVNFGETKTFPIGQNRRQAEVEALVEEIGTTEARRYKGFKFRELKQYGDLAVAPMINFLESSDPEEQELAAELLGDLGDTSAIKPLYGMLDHPWENVRVGAIESIVKLGDRDIIPTLISMLETEASSYPRSVIYKSFGKLKAVEAWDILVSGTREENKWTMMEAVRSMTLIDSQGTIPFLIPLFNSESAMVREEATILAHQIADSSLLPYLKELENDENYEIRFFARQAIRKIEANR